MAVNINQQTISSQQKALAYSLCTLISWIKMSIHENAHILTLWNRQTASRRWLDWYTDKMIPSKVQASLSLWVLMIVIKRHTYERRSGGGAAEGVAWLCDCRANKQTNHPPILPRNNRPSRSRDERQARGWDETHLNPRQSYCHLVNQINSSLWDEIVRAGRVFFCRCCCCAFCSCSSPTPDLQSLFCVACLVMCGWLNRIKFD